MVDHRSVSHVGEVLVDGDIDDARLALRVAIQYLDMRKGKRSWKIRIFLDELSVMVQLAGLDRLDGAGCDGR